MLGKFRRTSVKVGKTHHIFTTGAFVVSVKVKINGVEAWRWIVDSFEDDSFFDGKVFNPPEYANDFNQLITVSDD